MKILLVTGLTSFGIGGARAETLQLLKGLRAKGVDVALASDRRIEGAGPVAHFPIGYPPGRRTAEEIAHAVAAFGPDVVHAVGGGLRLLNACDAACTAAEVPWVCTVHNVPPAERIFPFLLRAPRLHYAVRDALATPVTLAWRRFLRRGRFRRAVCHSDCVAERLRLAGCPAERIVRVPLGCHEPPAADPSLPAVSGTFVTGAYPKILTVAGLAPHKGQLDALDVVARLLPDFPRLCYRMIGMSRDRRYAARLRRTITEKRLGDHVAIIHAAPEPTKWAALREADLYLQPSHEEGFCLAFLEAAACVSRVVGTRTGEMVAIAGENNVGARVIAVRDTDAQERAVRELLKVDPAQNIAIRRDRLFRAYSWPLHLEAHLRIYDDVMGPP